MQDIEKHLSDISEMRSMMDRNTRFLSLSGLSGVAAGVFALLGAGAAFWRMNAGITTSRWAYANVFVMSHETSRDLTLIGLAVLFCAVISALYLTWRKAKNSSDGLFNRASRKMIVNMMIPLATGGLFCLLLLYHGLYGLVAPATLLFYGLACLNASHYTLSEIRYIGIFNIILGLLNSLFIGYGLLFWAFGFGVLHIIYGVLMYLRYDSQEKA